MRILTWLTPLTALLTLALPACDRAGGSTDDASGERGQLEPSELVGSCLDACDGPSDGTCWCDEACTEFGDCCEDLAEYCASPMSCEGESPAGCVETGCGAGEVCSTETEACISSSCSCNEGTGTWDCTPDCGGGECVPEPDAAACEGENPAGCIEAGCGEDEVCSTDTEACISSECACDPMTGAWSCTPDCSGGECVPAGDEAACSDPNPADQCSDDPEACIPSECVCDARNGAWACTPDCSGGMQC